MSAALRSSSLTYIPSMTEEGRRHRSPFLINPAPIYDSSTRQRATRSDPCSVSKFFFTFAFPTSLQQINICSSHDAAKPVARWGPLIIEQEQVTIARRDKSDSDLVLTSQVSLRVALRGTAENDNGQWGERLRQPHMEARASRRRSRPLCELHSRRRRRHI